MGGGARLSLSAAPVSLRRGRASLAPRRGAAGGAWLRVRWAAGVASFPSHAPEQANPPDRRYAGFHVPIIARGGG